MIRNIILTRPSGGSSVEIESAAQRLGVGCIAIPLLSYRYFHIAAPARHDRLLLSSPRALNALCHQNWSYTGRLVCIG